ncbi:HPP family protein [Aquabacterium sp.]|uniref:HPP family protein n=1 Tax=Aquabacterium sp. TaxID=1872578 RepID=UPI002CF53545|nr:HPP family protein [Aquabacterium sp.]HSW04804.1 HPP family protein [Aquabacterium sp.]
MNRGMKLDWRQWLQALRPAPLKIDARERLRVVLGAGLGLLLAGGLCRWLGGPSDLAWLVAPLGASAVLVFGVPASPLAQPWAVLGGNTVSALVGIFSVHWLAPPALQAASAAQAVAGLPTPVVAAVGTALAIGAMLALRCLHPPGGAAALLTVLGGVTDWRFALFPVALNSLLLVAAGMVYNPLTGRRYPHAQREPAAAAGGALLATPPRFTEADLDAALAQYNQVLDVPRDDLQHLLEQAELQAHGRRLAALRCSDVMTRGPICVEFGSPLQEAWSLLRRHRIKALPVVDKRHRVVGIVTLADFLRAADLDVYDGFDDKLKRLIRATPGVHSDKPEVVGQIMTRQVRVASADRSLAELVPIFSSTGHHHIPIISGGERLVGIVTQTDLVVALLRSEPSAAKA